MTVWLRETGSTMKDAAALADRGEPHGTVVVAETQTAGIGRHGHSWHSESVGGLYLSIILRLPLAPDALPVLTMALGLATQRAVDDLAGVACDLRWPNDLLLNEKKLAGTMVQSADTPASPDALIAGIGVNVNQTDFPRDLGGLATSLRIETGREHSKEALLDRIVAESLKYASLLASRGKRTIFDLFEAHSTWVRGKFVDVDATDRIISGVTAGLDVDGFLLVQTPTGIETIVAGGVRDQAPAKNRAGS
jgi:BirA family transcriptional regulator, biotin operon repressor / biotin---[acetyl-CoA-carboxylase] ligase